MSMVTGFWALRCLNSTKHRIANCIQYKDAKWMWDLGGRFLNNALTMRICYAQHQKSRSCVSKSADPKGTADPFHIIPHHSIKMSHGFNVPWLGDVEHHQVGDYNYITIYPQYLGDVTHQDIYQPHPAKLSAQETLFGSVKIGTSVTCTLRHPASRCRFDDPQGFSWGNRFGVSWGFLLWQTTLYIPSVFF